MKTPPEISVCMACYNGARWLTSAVESVLNQSYRDFEIVLVDDGSTDNSLELARSYASRGVRVFSQPNTGQCAARNRALQEARGRFIKFFDVDDIMSPEMLARQAAALEKTPGCLAYGEWARFRDDPSEARFIPHPGWHDASPVDWLVTIWQDSEPMMQCGQFLIPRSVLNRTGGWDERLTLIDDFEFFTRVALGSDGILFTPGARLYYRSGIASSLSGRRTGAAWQSAFDSATSGIDQLLAIENSVRSRAAAANVLQGLVHTMYPDRTDLVKELEAKIRFLGGSVIRPQGGPAFKLCSRVGGWKTARRLQVLARRLRKLIKAGTAAGSGA